MFKKVFNNYGDVVWYQIRQLNTIDERMRSKFTGYCFALTISTYIYKRDRHYIMFKT